MMSNSTSDVSQRVEVFRDALLRSGFAGDVETDLGAREVASTDNSIYQVRPDAIVYPRQGSDINLIVKAATAPGETRLSLSARGGNTGTNGQSLNGGIVIDFGRHMNQILALEIDATGGWVTVQPGVVLDQLNARLAQQGLFFPPMVSTASRATIGGMVATDASGKGSRRWGKTSDYIEAMDVVLANGADCRIEPMSIEEARKVAAGDDMIAGIHREALRVVLDNADEIDRVFPKMNRGLTGYNLQKMARLSDDYFFLAPLLAGSEGTLALTKSIRLRVVPKPAAKALVVLRYSSFDGGLRDVDRLLESDPVAVEILDDKVTDVARTDVIWGGIAAALGNEPDVTVKALSFMEFAGTVEEVEAGLRAFERQQERCPASLIDFKLIRDSGMIARLWTLREKSVGLLARLGGGRQGVPFVEDTAVPPEQLADYVADFRALLDGHGLKYGMFGHADVGCLHVRPFLDMKEPSQAALIRPISDGVAQLTKNYGGLLWGEHGRGFRGEYSPFFFGPTLYAELIALKRTFDPENILNPGKLASPTEAEPVDRIDGVPLRGEFDRQVEHWLRKEYDRAIACNGNGACFSWDAQDAMCPSYKATRDRSQSPKGRAALLRAWARTATDKDSEDAIEIERATVKSLSTCLSCKACTSLCPVQVDIPTMKSRFLYRYYQKRPRPQAHRLLGNLEALLGLGRAMPALANGVANMKTGRFLTKLAGFVDLPRFTPPLRRSKVPVASPASLQYSRTQGGRAVVLVEDSFTSTFEGRLVDEAYDLLQRLGYDVYRLPVRSNGKALHVLGMRRPFAAIARKRVSEMRALADAGATLLGLDAATALMHEHEYTEFVDRGPPVMGFEQLLMRDIAAGKISGRSELQSITYRLFSHCTETSLRPQSAEAWKGVLAHFGIVSQIHRTGCCGMSGMFGHESENQGISVRLYELSWRTPVEEAADRALATGFSCRCQVKRLSGQKLRHPVELINQVLAEDSVRHEGMRRPATSTTQTSQKN